MIFVSFVAERAVDSGATRPERRRQLFTASAGAPRDENGLASVGIDLVIVRAYFHDLRGGDDDALARHERHVIGGPIIRVRVAAMEVLLLLLSASSLLQAA